MSKYRLVVIAGDSSACTYYRNVLPTLHCHREVPDVDFTLADSMDLLPNDILDYDCFIFSRIYKHRFILQFVMSLVEAGKRIVWDMDDDFLSIPSWSPVLRHFPRSAIRELQFCLRLSDAITVSTANLKDRVVECYPVERDRVHVLENLIDLTFYERLRDQDPPGHRKGPIRVIWTGSSSHTGGVEARGDVAPFVHLYNKYKDDDRFAFFTYGHRLEGFETSPPDRMTSIGWGSKRFYEPTLAALSPSISIIPVQSCKFNSCKSAIKYYESTAAGAVSIASHWPPYSDVIIPETTGFLAKPIFVQEKDGDKEIIVENFDKWEEAFEAVASSRWTMSQVQRNAMGHVRDHYSWHADNYRRRAWIDFFRGLPGISPRSVG